MDSKTGHFAYVAIPESSPTRRGLNRPFKGVSPALLQFASKLPPHLTKRDMHLDPDFEHLTYGDGRERAKQIRSKLEPGDLIVFYAGLRNVQPPQKLVYALIGLYVVDEIVDAVAVPAVRRHENAHTRIRLPNDSTDIVVRARRDVSGRLERCIPIGDYRERAYRVRPNLLTAWGQLNVKNGYLQRSARLPEFRNASRFYDWFQARAVPMARRNN
jgi:hypothetical protein